MTDEERMRRLHAMQAERCGYELHVWTWEDAGGVVHLLNYSSWRAGYTIRCDPRRLLRDDERVPPNLKMPTCVRCSLTLSPRDLEPP